MPSIAYRHHRRPLGACELPGWRWWLLLTLVAVISACGGDAPSQPVPEASGAPAAPGSVTVGPEGGRVDAAGRALLTIPPGALSASVVMQLTQAPPEAQSATAGYKPAGEQYSLLPDGLLLARPATVRLPFDPGLVGAGEKLAVLSVASGQPVRLIGNLRMEGDAVVFETRRLAAVRVVSVPAATVTGEDASEPSLEAAVLPSAPPVPEPVPAPEPAPQPGFPPGTGFQPSLPPPPDDNQGTMRLFGENLPSQVLLRSDRISFNAKYAAVLADDGVVYLRRRNPTTGWVYGPAWVPLPATGLPKALQSISMDDQALVAVDEDGRLASLGRDVFTLGTEIPSGVVNWDPQVIAGAIVEVARLGPLRGLNRASAEEISEVVRWSTRWGSLLGSGPGHVLPPQTRAWALSLVTPWEDGYYVDAGNAIQNIGGAGCTSLFALYDGGRRIALMDPWLPNDYSYEVGMPQRGRFVAQGLSASGSTIFIIGPDGQMWIRRVDFDMSGSDVSFFPAAFDRRPAPLASAKAVMDTVVFGKSVNLGAPSMRVMLSTQAEPWIEQPRIAAPPGTVLYDGISIHKAVDVGGEVLPGVDRRVLRVPAVQQQGPVQVAGYFEREVSTNCGLPGGVCGPQTTWSAFVPFAFPGGKPPGQPLGSVPLDVTPSTNAMPLSYGGQMAGLGVAVSDFLLHNSPAQITLEAPGRRVTLPMHHFDGMRQVLVIDQTRQGANGGRDVDEHPRQMYANIELTDEVMTGMLADPLGAMTVGLGTLLGPLAGSCPPGTQREVGVLCVPVCPAGTDALGLSCVARCPSGWRDNGLGGCEKPSYVRPGYFLNPWGCRRAHGPCEHFLGVWYPRTRPGFYCVGPVCSVSRCPAAGMLDIGLVCLKASSPRGLPTLAVPRMIPLILWVSQGQMHVSLDLSLVVTDGLVQGPGWTLPRR